MSYFLLSIILIVAFTGGFHFQLKAGNKPRPNIIFFLVDDLGWQDTSEPFWNKLTDNNRKYHTPNMEELADQGVKFTQSYACAISSPTRVSMLSGMNAARHRVTNWTLRRGQSSVQEPDMLSIPEWNLNGAQPCDSIERSVHITSLPSLLQKSGYFTIHCGKAHFGAIGTPGEDPLNFGFDVNIAGHAAGAPGSYLGENHYSSNHEDGGNIWDVPGLEKYHGTATNLTEALTIEALSAVDAAVEEGKPFYLYMAHYGVHTPLQPDDRFYQKYKNLGYAEPEARYASMVESVDKSLGDIMAYLSDNNLSDNTIIIFMSDNGGLSAVARGGEPHTHNKPLSSGKGSAHEGGIREPMIVSWPGVTQPETVCNSYVIAEDFFPTILEMANIEDYQTIQSVDGISFVPQLTEPEFSNKTRPLFWHYPNNWGPSGPGIAAYSTIRIGDWKLIYYHHNESFELFNISEDIGETDNRAAEEPEVLRSLATKLSDYLISVEAQMPTHKSNGKQVHWPSDSLNDTNSPLK